MREITNVYVVRSDIGEPWARYYHRLKAEEVATRMTNEGCGRAYFVHKEPLLDGEVVSFTRGAA